MPQEIRVLCCAECKVYQVDIVKKAKKWQCKMCGKKQSVLKEFLRGSGAECRKIAQELNFITKTDQCEEENEILNLLEQNDLDTDLEFIAKQETNFTHAKPTESKWTKYVDTSAKKSYEEDKVIKLGKRTIELNSSEAHSSKYPKLFVPANSKWNAYL